MDSDEEDFVFYGTPIEREEDVSSRKKKAVAEASGQLRTLVPWKQEVRDEEGRRRFHGAFSGGFSAGYYNTVGSKEGWTPSSFTSSRKSRAEVKQQSIYSFLDEDEKAELEGHSLGTSMQFDTFGFTAAELARKQAEKEQQERPSAIPGPVPDEIVAPVTESIGMKLLVKMGWRRGRSIKDSQTDVLYDARREARKSFLALASDDPKAQVAGSDLVEEEIQNVTDVQTDGDDHFSRSTPVYVLNPKQDLHGLGYDPYKNAPEFREKKRSRLSGNGEMGHRKPLSMRDSLFGFKSGRVAPGFGIGALEDLDVEDEDVYASGYDFEETFEVEDIEEPSRPTIGNVKMLDNKEHGILPGFKAAANSDYQLERFNPPVIPKDFIPRHTFTAPLEVGNRVTDVPPPDVPPPEDSNLNLLIEGVASLVARCGKLFEDLSREKNQSNPLFAFLNGGNGHEYYERRLWEEQQKRNDKTERQLDSKMLQNVKKMTAESRGRILGEKPLERSSRDSSSLVTPADTVNLQINLSDTFTKPASLSDHPEVAKPFLNDPAKQDRFEQFLKEKYRGGLRAKDAGGSSNMSEAARARERLEFEAAAETIGKGKSGKESKHPNQLLADILASSRLQFTAGAVEHPKDSHDEGLALKKLYPKREEFQWRPAPILCKRFDLIDPYMGKPPPPPRAKSKMESFVFVPDSTKAAKVDESVTMARDLSSVAELDREDKDTEATDKEIEVDVKAENVERPVDLYKAIFSDDSDEEGDITNPSQQDEPEKKTEAANTTLSRLIAGDFLESLGKELGLEVPPDMPYSETKASVPASQKESTNAKEEKERLKAGSKSSTPDAFGGNSTSHELEGKPHHQEGRSHINETTDGDNNVSKINETTDVKNGASKNKLEKVAQEDGKSRPSRSGHRHLNSSSSEDERTRKRRRHQSRSSSPDSETPSSSYDYEDRHRSRSKKKKKGSSREKSSSRSRSKHHKHKRRDSPHRSRHRSEKEHRELKKERHKHKDRG